MLFRSGGCGAKYRITLYDDKPNLVMFGDGKKFPPYGLYGGKPGSCNIAFINEGIEGERELKAKESVPLKKGDSYSTYPSGGGGWGDPKKRDPELVRLDVKNGIVSIEQAKSIYGVVLPEAARTLRRQERCEA